MWVIEVGGETEMVQWCRHCCCSSQTVMSMMSRRGQLGKKGGGKRQG